MWVSRLFDLYELLDTLTAVTYGMLAVWVVRSSWHWSVRFAVGMAAVLALLLLNDSALVLRYGVATAALAGGLLLWRGLQSRRSRNESDPSLSPLRPRVSLRDLLLMTVAAAVLLTVAIKAPPAEPYKLIFAVVDGLILAALGMMLAWPILGGARPAVRFVALPFVILLSVFAVWLWFGGFGSSLASSLGGLRQFDRAWQSTLQRVSRFFSNFANERRFLASFTLGAIVFCGWLWLVKSSGWLRWPDRAQMTPQASRRTLPHYNGRSKLLAVAIATALIAAIPVYAFAKLAFPPSLPPDVLAYSPEFVELERIGQALLDKNNGNPSIWRRATDAQFQNCSKRVNSKYGSLMNSSLAGLSSPGWCRARANQISRRSRRYSF